MNLSDIRNQAIELEGKLLEIEGTIEALRSAVNQIDIWKDYSLKSISNFNISNSSTIYNQSVELNKQTNVYYMNFLKELRDLNFVNALFILRDIRNDFEYFNVNMYIDNFIECYNIIHSFISENGTEKNLNLFKDTFESVNKMIFGYDALLQNTCQVKKIGDKLIGPLDQDTFKIRLLSEDNEISNLINNLNLINSIYNSINFLVGDSSAKLTYTRAESGTFEIDLTGCATTLSALVPILTFTYKVYTDNFSWKAKQEKVSGEIKVRGEYIKLLKEVNELKDMDVVKTSELVGKLDDDLKELYINNPSIMLNNVELGMKEIMRSDISKPYISEVIKEICATSDNEGV